MFVGCGEGFRAVGVLTHSGITDVLTDGRVTDQPRCGFSLVVGGWLVQWGGEWSTHSNTNNDDVSMHVLLHIS